MTTRKLVFLAWAATFSLTLVSCGEAEPDSGLSETDASETPAETSSAEEDEVSGSVQSEIPETSVGEVTERILEIYNGQEDSSAQDWEELLSDEFLADFPMDQFLYMVNIEIRPQGPFSVIDYQEDESGSFTHLETEEEELDLIVYLTDDGLVLGIFLQPYYEPLSDPPASLDEIEQRLDEMPADSHLLVLEDGEEVLSIDSDEPAPMASIFKLWVLEALTAAIDQGETSWDETLELGEEHMSLPTGALHYEDPGFELSVFEAAQAMIANSDNTATDLLIDHLGRSFIEQSIQEAGRYSPELLQPLLTTREVFQLRWGHEDLGEEFVDASPARQQEILDELAEMPLEISSPDMVPDEGAAYGLEWYGSAEDIAAVHESLHSSRGAHPDLRHILGDHQDLLSEDPWWTTHSYKGGNTQGVFSGSWRVEGTDGTTRIVVLQVSGTPQDVTPLELEYTSIAQSALELEPLD